MHLEEGAMESQAEAIWLVNISSRCRVFVPREFDQSNLLQHSRHSNWRTSGTSAAYMENTNNKPSPPPPPRTPRRHPLPSGRGQGSDQRSRERRAHTDSGGDRQRHGVVESGSGSERKRNRTGSEAGDSRKRRMSESLSEYGQTTPSRRENLSTDTADAAEGN